MLTSWVLRYCLNFSPFYTFSTSKNVSSTYLLNVLDLNFEGQFFSKINPHKLRKT